MLLLLVLRAAGAGTALWVTILIGHMHGAAALGEFAVATMTANLIATIAIAGMDGAIVKIASVSIDSSLATQARGQVIIAARIALTTTFAGTVFLLAAALRFDVKPLAIAALACPAIGLTRIYAAAARASGVFAASALFAGIIPSATLLTMIFAFNETVNALAAEFVISWWIAAFAALTLHYSRDNGPVVLHTSMVRPLLYAGLPIGLANVSDVTTSWAVLTIVTSVLGDADAGGMRIAMQLVGVVGLVLIAADDALAPRLAVSLKRGDHASADRLLNHTRRWCLCVAGPMLVVFATAPSGILSIVDAELSGGASALRWLAILNFLSLVVGPAGTALAMGAAPRRFGELALVSLFVAVFASALLVPLVGVAGGGIGLGGAVLFRRWLGRRTFTVLRRNAA